MARGPRVVAELGRPETPDEIAARKAESSRVYRSSQTFRNLIAALLATVGLVAVIVLAVPRADYAERPPIDVAALAADAEAAFQRDIVVAPVPADWRVNGASVDASTGGVTAWVVIYAPENEGGFVRVAQGFDADEAWTRSLLEGAAPRDTIDIDGREWSSYRLSGGDSSRNVTHALSTQVGPDQIVIYGSVAETTAQTLAGAMNDQLTALENGR